MGMELYIALAIRALLHLDPEMMKNIPFDAVHHSPMQRHNELGDLIADLLDFRIVILHSGDGQFKSGNKGRDRVDIKTNHPGLARDDLVRQGDVAMYEAKRLGKRRYCVYSASLE